MRVQGVLVVMRVVVQGKAETKGFGSDGSSQELGLAYRALNAKLTQFISLQFAVDLEEIQRW